jgi:hypothetical protein
MSKPGTVVIKCGGENRASLKRDGAEVPLGGGQPMKVVRIFKCDSEYQDGLYGKDMRVANHAPSKGAAENRYRCATCLKEHIVN